MRSYRKARRFWRRLAPLMVVCFAGSSTLGPVASARALAPPPARGHTRPLTPAEMRHITGAQAQGIAPLGPITVLPLTTPLEENAGAPRPWEGGAGGVNTINGNKLTELPLVGWSARGGLPVPFTLYHNSRGAYNGELGAKWTHSYSLYLAPDSLTENMAVHWADGQTYLFTQNLDGSYSPPAGIYDRLVALGDPVSRYELTTPSQVTYTFTNPNGSGWFCTSIADPNGNTIAINRNSTNRVTSVVDPTGRTLTLGYDSTGKLTSVTDPQNRVWTIAYTSSRVSCVTWPLLGGASYTVQFGYNTNNCLTTLTDRRGYSWTFSYNPNGSLAWEKDPYLHQTSFAYTSTQTTVTDPNSHTTKHNYDASGRLSSEVDARNLTESYGYDASNNRTRVTDRRGKLWQYTFDSRGNVLSATDPLEHTTTGTYNSMNRVLTVTDPLGHVVENTYDATLGWNLTQTQLKDSDGTVLSTTGFGVNSYGLVTSRTDDNNHTTNYDYNTHGDLTSVTTPRSRVTSFGVNTLGVRTSRTDALNRTTSYTLDAWDRVTATDYPTGTDPTFSYDPNGNLTGWTDAQGAWARAYDNAGRLTSESLNSTTRFSYTYDATGKKGLLSTMTDPNGRVLTYSYTARNELYQVAETAGTTTYGYDNAGNETGITNPNGTTVTKVYDDAGRLTSVTNQTGGGTTLCSFSYGYNDDGLRTSCTETDGAAVSYGYDGAHRLTSESRTGANAFTRSYEVDGVGNRTGQTVGGTTTSFTYNEDDELTGTSGGFVNSYSYNANGEQTGRTLSGTASTLAYDNEGQLTSITSGGSTVTFAYDALGRRISRTAGGVTTQLLSDPSGRVWLEAQGQTVTATYTYGNALVRKDGEYPLFDGLGSERTVTNGSQGVTGTLCFEAFGQTIATSGSSANPYQFAATSGYRDDGDAGLVHVGARYYDPQVGRFITRDTVLSEHPYLYCEHDPVNATDPSGHDNDPFGAALSFVSGLLATAKTIKEFTPRTMYGGIWSSAPGGAIFLAPVVVKMSVSTVALTATAYVVSVGAAAYGGYKLSSYLVEETGPGRAFTNWLGSIIAKHAPWLE